MVNYGALIVCKSMELVRQPSGMAARSRVRRRELSCRCYRALNAQYLAQSNCSMELGQFIASAWLHY